MTVSLGAAIYIALKPILKIYTIMIVGYLLARYDIVSMETARGISNMVVNAILPCLTFNKIVSGISDKDIKEVGVIVLSAILLFAVGSSCSMITKLVTPVPKKWFWGLVFAGVFPNISDLPIAYVQSMGNGAIFTAEAAEKGVAYCCIFLISQSFLMMNFGMWRLVGLDFKDKSDNSDQVSELEEGLVIEKNSETNDSVKISESVPELHLHSRSEGLSPSGNFEAHELRSLDSNAIESENSNEAHDSYASQETQSLADSVESFGLAPVQDFSQIQARRTLSVVSSPSALENSRIKPYFTTEVRSLSGRSSDVRSRRLSASTRKRRPSMNDVIEEYSVADRIKQGELDLSRPLTLTEDLGYRNASLGMIDEDDECCSNDEINENSSCSLPRHPTSTLEKTKSKFTRFIVKYKLQWLEYVIINFIRPASLGALIGIIVAMIPWVKALFVHTDVHVHNAPDGLPVLNFLMDFTSYIGNACVPLGLLLLGGTIARLEVKTLPKGFLKVAILMTFFRLMVIPVIGVAWANKLYKLNWLDTIIGKFVMILTWSMPSATAQVYFTAFYTPLKGSHEQLDCLSVFIMMQYAILFITVPFVITYTIKVDLNL